jgi:dedicator of cytokinesis protein 3
MVFIHHSGRGKAWENAIEICKELAYQHAEVTFN